MQRTANRALELGVTQRFRLVMRADLVDVDIKMPSVYISIMIKTQIQLPDCLYREVKRVAREREMSLAEVLRRGVEYITRVYPPLVMKEDGAAWHVPKAVRTHLRQGVSLENLRDISVNDEEPLLAAGSRSSRQTRQV